MYKNIALIVLGVLVGTIVFGFVMGVVGPYFFPEMMTLEEAYHILTTPAWQITQSSNQEMKELVEGYDNSEDDLFNFVESSLGLE
jgi:hypothetical protein